MTTQMFTVQIGRTQFGLVPLLRIGSPQKAHLTKCD